MTDELKPNVSTMRVFESNGVKYRIYLTMGDIIVVDRRDDSTGEWKHAPLREASEQDLLELLQLRYQSEDDEIARTLGSYT